MSPFGQISAHPLATIQYASERHSNFTLSGTVLSVQYTLSESIEMYIHMNT